MKYAVTQSQAIITLVVLIIAVIIYCSAYFLTSPLMPSPSATPTPIESTYVVRKLKREIIIDADWNKEVWRETEHLQITHYMGEKPEHQPKTYVKLLYDDENIYLIFRVEDRYVRAIAQEYHGHVWEDSCVEFFFTPGPSIKEGYFNLEINCGGTFLFCHQTARGQNVKCMERSDCQRLEIAHSMPKIVDPEITEPVTWTVEIRIPLEILEKYAPVTKPAPGVIWRANFYKCADKTSHPHWLTWSVVDYPTPNFHLPEFFGVLKFTE